MTRWSYGAVAWCYEEIAAFYSLGRIARAKAWQITRLEPGARILYAGVGRGEDARLAARAGAEVTGVDVSEAMLRRCRRRFAREGLNADLRCEDLFDHRPTQPYDFVAANFVLNVFPEPVMRRALAHLVSLLQPRGSLLIADFAPPAMGSRAQQWLFSTYYRPVNLAARALGLAALHPIYDYESAAQPLGLVLRGRRCFSPFYQSIELSADP